MSAATTRTGIVVLLAILVVGCSSTPRSSERPARPAETASSVEDVAARLGLEVASSTRRGAVLRNEGNTVSVFPDPRGRAYVNGAAVGKAGGLVVREGVIQLPPAVEAAIGAALLPPSGIAPAPPAPGVIKPVPARPVGPSLGRVVIDAGHGGKDPGSPRSTNGSIDEKVVNLDVALRLERKLRSAGLDVLMTRKTDVSVDLGARPAFGNRHRPKLFVSIHANAMKDNRAVHGAMVFVAEKARSDSVAAARYIQAELVRLGIVDRGVHRRDLRVVRMSRGPAVLVEMGFLTNRAEGRRLASSSHREKLASAIARGILAYLNRP